MSPSESEISPDEGPPLNRRRRSEVGRFPLPGRWVLLGFAIAFGMGLLGAYAVTQTNWGRAQVLGYTVQTLGGRLDGELVIERLSGNLFTGARLYGISLRGRDGYPLLLADSAFIQYRVATFLGGDIVINRLEVWSPEVFLRRLPGDTLWNYQAILRDPDPPEIQPAVAAANLIARLRLHDARIAVRGPLEPDPRLSPDRQRAALAEILADERWMVEEVPGGYLRVILIDVEEAGITELFVGPDERGGIYLEVNEGRADVRLWSDPPLEIEALRAQLHLREGIVNFHAPEVQLPETLADAIGGIDLRGDRPLYDVVLTTPRFALADLRWLYPWLPVDPAAGIGSARLRIQDLPDELLVLAQDLVLEMPRTRITGRFGILAGETLRFVDVDLEADPLDLDAVEQLFPEEFPIDGLHIGGAVIRGE
jgi:hypothetical protein